MPHQYADKMQDQNGRPTRFGWPFPAGPMIPRPDASQPLLWSGLTHEKLVKPNARPYAAFTVIRQRYSLAKEKGGGRNWFNDSHGIPMALLEWCLRTGECQCETHSQRRDVMLKILEDLADHAIKYSSDRFDIERAVEAFKTSIFAKKGAQLSDVHMKEDAVFDGGAHFYQFRLRKLQYGISGRARTQYKAVPFSKAVTLYPQRQQHMRELFDDDMGEWQVLTLLFFKLIHLHLAWVPSINLDRASTRRPYQILVPLLDRCAYENQHPLADVAAAIARHLPRLQPFFQPAVSDLTPLDARHGNLPDCLLVDVLRMPQTCEEEARQWFVWAGLTDLAPWVDDVAKLAMEVASAYTDPFALGALGLWGHRDVDPDHQYMRLAQYLGHLDEVMRSFKKWNFGRAPEHRDKFRPLFQFRTEPEALFNALWLHRAKVSMRLVGFMNTMQKVHADRSCTLPFALHKLDTPPPAQLGQPNRARETVPSNRGAT